jgi:hypothetical protein
MSGRNAPAKPGSGGPRAPGASGLAASGTAGASHWDLETMEPCVPYPPRIGERDASRWSDSPLRPDACNPLAPWTRYIFDQNLRPRVGDLARMERGRGLRWVARAGAWSASHCDPFQSFARGEARKEPHDSDFAPTQWRRTSRGPRPGWRAPRRGEPASASGPAGRHYHACEVATFQTNRPSPAGKRL